MNQHTQISFYTLKQLITQAKINLYNAADIFIHHKNLDQYIKNRLSDFKPVTLEIDKKISPSELNSIIKTPIIFDITTTYMDLQVFTYFLRLPENKLPRKGQIINYIVGFVEENFPFCANEDGIEAVRCFWNVLFSFYEELTDRKFYQKGVLTKEGAWDFPQYFIEDILGKYNINNLEKKLNYFIKIDFKYPKQPDTRIQEKYMSAMKDLFQIGFIYLLGDYKFNDFYVPPLLSSQHSMQTGRSQIYMHNDEFLEQRREKWKNIFDTTDITYVIGGPGYGKSLFLHNLINNSERLSISKYRDYIVVYCDLKTFYTYGDPSKKTMVGFFTESMIKQTGLDISEEFVQCCLDNGRCLILLDALDEVPKEVRDELHKKIIAFFSTQNPYNRICITSRSRGFVGRDKIEVIKILPLIDKDIEAYIDRMITLGKFKDTDKAQFMKQAKVLIDKKFLNNFLVLSLLVNIYKAEKALPENKVELYKKCFEYIAKKREKEDHKTNCNWELISPILKESTFISLAELAAPNNKDIDRDAIEQSLVSQYSKKFADIATTERAISEFLDFCSSRTELFVLSSKDDKFKFFHRSFFEYFYSRYIYHLSNVEEMYRLMSKFDVDSEVYELTLAMVKEDQEGKYQALVSYIIDKAIKELSLRRPKYVAFSILTVGMQVVDDAYFITEYYKLVIEYSDILAVKYKQYVNQKLVSMWIKKAISYDKTRYDELLNLYGMYCIVHVFLELSKINNRILEKNNFENNIVQMIVDEKEIAIKNTSAYSSFIVNTSYPEIPFYMCLFDTPTDLRQFIEHYTSQTFEQFLQKNVKDIISEKEIKKLKKGYDAYKALSDELTEKLLAYFLW